MRLSQPTAAKSWDLETPGTTFGRDLETPGTTSGFVLVKEKGDAPLSAHGCKELGFRDAWHDFRAVVSQAFTGI